MNGNSLNEQELYHFFEEDSKKAGPDQSIKARLIYHLQVKSLTYRIRQNSFGGMFAWLFTLKYLPAKATLASIILIFTLVNFHDKTPLPGQLQLDSASFYNRLYLDTAILRPFNNDTCYLKL